MKKLLKNKNGVTLVELIVGMVIFAIITTSAAAVLVPTLNVYVKANELAESNTLLDNLANEMINDLSKSIQQPTLSNNNMLILTDGVSQIKYSIGSSGELLKDDDYLLPKDFYKGKSVSFSCQPITDQAVKFYYKLTVIISSDTSGEMIRRDYVVKPLALNQFI